MRTLTRLLLLIFSTPASTIVSNRRILLLHNIGSSAGAFMNRGSMGFQGAASASYHDGGRLAWGFGALDWDAGIEDDIEWGDWFRVPNAADASAKGYAATEKAIALIEETFIDGGYDGILGFSEGAMIASVVAARAALGEEGACTGSLRFAILCGGAVPTPYEELLERLQASKQSIPTAHCMSKADAKHGAEQGERLARYFGEEAMVAYHDGGHAMPSAKECKPVVSYVDEAAPNAYFGQGKVRG